MGYAAILIPLLNASAKYLGTKYPIAEIVWARYAGHFIYMVILFAPRRGLSLLVSRRPGLQFIRSALLFTSTAIYFSALHYVPLATATAIGFTAPFIVTALAPLVLGERVGTRRWIAVGLGFVGALAVVRPGEDAVPLAAFLVFGSAVTSASYQLITRKLAFHDPAETSITYIAVVGFLLATLALPFFWRTPDSLMDIAVFVALGLFGGFGHYFMVRAYEMAPAPFVSPFNYGQLVGTVALGYFIFAQFPDVWTWLGAAIIVASGLDMLFAEARGKARVPE
jgi:drug/metabolite transporter (DMT)-like permease